MKSRKINHPIDGFDYSALTDPDFKEDSVREEIIVPILAKLGYKASGKSRIIRSKSLEHPYVSIGSQKRKINVVPDYLLEVDGHFAWVLEAKGPDEKITKSAHVEQAYSYAIHPDIRVQYYALCNGHEFVLYDISEKEPIFHCSIQELGIAWEDICRYLAPENIKSQSLSPAKDFGLHIDLLGFGSIKSLILFEIPVHDFALIDENRYRFSGAIQNQGTAYLASFHFDSIRLSQLAGKVPEDALNFLKQPYKNQSRHLSFGKEFIPISVDCKLGADMKENDSEIFRPFDVNRFI